MNERQHRRLMGRVCSLLGFVLALSVAFGPSVAAQTPIPPIATVPPTVTPYLPPANGQFVPTLQGQPLLDALRRGGYVVYFRHGTTDQSRQDGVITDYNDCSANQRLLSEAGRQESRTIGQSFRTLSIPVGRVLSSEYCRTREMADLMFGRYDREPALSFTKEDRANYFRLLSTQPDAGTNTVLVGHVPGISSAVGLVLNEGEAGIFDPTEPNNPRFVARVMPNDWITLLPPNVSPTTGEFMPLLKGQALLDTLRRGGYVIYFRHAATDFATQDNNVVIGNCATQRNLSEQGRTDARTIGQSFRTLGIPVGRVGSSEYCRDREMGQLSFGRYEDEPVITLNNENPANYLRLLSMRPDAGMNTVLLGHVPGISSAVGFSPNEGEAGIFDPTEPGNPRFVARVLPNEWIKLAPAVVQGTNPQFTPLLEGRPLVDAMRRGGYVVYFRHGTTDQSRQDMLPIPDYNDCGTQRLLNEAGRQESRVIGQQFTALNIPVGRVLASEFCRTREMSTLMFGRFDLEPALTYTKENAAEYLRLLSTRPAAGMNTVLVGHVPGISSAIGLSLNEGEAAIFDPAEPNAPRFVARVGAAEWAKLLGP